MEALSSTLNPSGSTNVARTGLKIYFADDEPLCSEGKLELKVAGQLKAEMNRYVAGVVQEEVGHIEISDGAI